MAKKRSQTSPVLTEEPQFSRLLRLTSKLIVNFVIGAASSIYIAKKFGDINKLVLFEFVLELAGMFSIAIFINFMAEMRLTHIKALLSFCLRFFRISKTLFSKLKQILISAFAFLKLHRVTFIFSLCSLIFGFLTSLTYLDYRYNKVEYDRVSNEINGDNIEPETKNLRPDCLNCLPDGINSRPDGSNFRPDG
jgi:hypothetical protein